MRMNAHLDRTEDPALALDHAYQTISLKITDVRRSIIDVTTQKQRLKSKAEELQKRVVELDTQARQAASQGRDELALVALERKQLVQLELMTMDQQVTDLQNQQTTLENQARDLQQKIEQFRQNKEIIKAQYTAAEARVRISEAATGVGEDLAEVGLMMQRSVQKIEDMKARAVAVEELEQSGTLPDLLSLGTGDSVDRELRQLNMLSTANLELDRIKGELAAGDELPPAA